MHKMGMRISLSTAACSDDFKQTTRTCRTFYYKRNGRRSPPARPCGQHPSMVPFSAANLARTRRNRPQPVRRPGPVARPRPWSWFQLRLKPLRLSRSGHFRTVWLPCGLDLRLLLGGEYPDRASIDTPLVQALPTTRQKLRFPHQNCNCSAREVIEDWTLSSETFAPAGAGNRKAQFWWMRPLSLAPPSSIVLFNHLSLVWVTILGFAIRGGLPTPKLLLGSMTVVASGLYILCPLRNSVIADGRLKLNFRPDTRSYLKGMQHRAYIPDAYCHTQAQWECLITFHRHRGGHFSHKVCDCILNARWV
jgi:hypothetical protein